MGLLLTIVLGTFGTWYYVEGGHRHASRDGQRRVAVVLLDRGRSCGHDHGGRDSGRLEHRREKDRRTLDFLLATRLGNAEIVLGKLAACLARFFTSLAAGLPVVLLLNLLGGVDPRLILLAYGGIASTVFFVLAISIWISTGAGPLAAPPAFRRSASSPGCTFLSSCRWSLPRLGLRCPASS